MGASPLCPCSRFFWQGAHNPYHTADILKEPLFTEGEVRPISSKGDDEGDDDAQSLEARLSALEQRATRYRNAFVGVALIMSGVVLVAATNTDEVHEVVTTKMLRVVNGQGNVVAGIMTHPLDGSGLLMVNSKDEKRLINAGASASGNGVLTVYTKDGKELIYAGASTSGTGGLFILTNKTGETVVQLEADEYGNGVVGAYNRKGKGRTLESGP